MVFTDLPLLERVRRIDELGFGVEIWDWTTKDVDALVATGATFSSMTGYVRGDLADPEGADALLAHGGGVDPGRGAARHSPTEPARHRARRRGLPVRPVGEVTGPMWVAAVGP